MTGQRFFQMVPLVLCLIATLVLSGCGSAARNAEASTGNAQPAWTAAPGVSTGHAGAATAAKPASAAEASAKPVNAGAAAKTVAAPAMNATQPTAALRVAASLTRGPGEFSGQVTECWQPLLQRLHNDPAVRPEALRYFCGLPEYSPAPMGAKVKELFTSAFLRKKPVDDGRPKLPPSRIYRNVVTAATLQKCNDFLARNKAVFDAVEKKYPVPREVLVSLLYVETRLGTYVGKDNAFWSLACMAAADRPELVAGGMGDIPITDKHNDWLQARLADKSRWAYNELRALLDFCHTQQLDPSLMPGSVYGAIGICQFMPSNLETYGEDGDGDGVVNLFSEPDAIFSAARYLTKHGWSADMNVARRRAMLKRYNNLTIYANTILALAESVRTGVLQTGPPDMVQTVAASKKKTAASGKKVAAAGKAAAPAKKNTLKTSSAKKK